ncbi:flagellin N-terminal helical domain-containing protein [Clostridium hydrogenum]|uniref:flagellin N-terminal helical domain-containing protein n=1 Tax=Clostridium hydrogenum TaxID=2855764 RepID=UPI001F15E4A6|nr:flagellin [Clostridium hydrogenum]
MQVGHNMWSFNIFTKYKSALTDQTKAMNTISSGLRVNNAMDDPYAIAKDENFNLQLRGLQKASSNAQDTINLVQTADSALGGISSLLDRIRELAVQNKNDTYNSDNRSDSQTEVSNLINEIDHLAKSTNINDVNLLNSASGSIKCMIGSNIGETIDIPTFDFQAASIKDASGNALTSIDVTTSSGCSQAMDIIDSAISSVNSARNKFGALENRLDTSITNGSEISEETQAGDSSIMDADVAAEMMRYSKDSIIVQAGTAMMAQSNKFPQEVLNILQNVK